MKHKELSPGLNYDEILLKLGSKARNVSLLSGEDDGWVSRLAWDPCGRFVLSEGLPGDDLHGFIKKHNTQGHLLIGYVSYELGYPLHGLRPTKKDDLRLPLLMVFAYDNYLEKKDGRSFARYRRDGFLDELERLSAQPTPKHTDKPVASPFRPAQSRQAYSEAFARIKEYILNGVIYQVNLTQRLQAETEENPRSIYNSLSASNTAKMKAYIEGEGFELISMSPERFIKTIGSSITTTPIKGTRPRGKNKAEDDRNLSDLIKDEKEKAELNMITDLLRNDLGKICATGSVDVIKEQATAKLSKVMHTFSVIEGRLRPETSPMHALLSMFPGGSITGCPKRKAMEIIDRLEPRSRSVYCGSVFCIDDKGDMDSNILIRTLIKKGPGLILPVGSGIVHDSIEEKEYQENLDKAASITEVLVKN